MNKIKGIEKRKVTSQLRNWQKSWEFHKVC